MALRAHTSEAVSPKAVQPKELPPSYLLFDGQWQQMDIHPVITYNIEDSVVKRSDGVELSLTARYRPSSFHCTLINGSGDTVCSGTYTPNRCITWQNGLVWKRVDDSSVQRCQHSDIGDFIAKQSNAICSSSLKEEGSPNVQALALNNSPEYSPPAITSKPRGQPPSAPMRMSVQSPLATTSKSRGQPPSASTRPSLLHAKDSTAHCLFLLAWFNKRSYEAIGSQQSGGFLRSKQLCRVEFFDRKLSGILHMAEGQACGRKPLEREAEPRSKRNALANLSPELSCSMREEKDSSGRLHGLPESG